MYLPATSCTVCCVYDLAQRPKSTPRNMRPAVDANVSALFQPLDQHVKAVIRELVSQLRRLNVIMTEVRCRVVFT